MTDLPRPAGPTDAELMQLAIDTRLYRFQATAGDPIMYELTDAQIHAFARAVLARWGNTSSTDYKQLCGELLNRLNGLYEEFVDAGVGYVPDEAQDLMNRARAVLAAPEGDLRQASADVSGVEVLSPAAQAVLDAFDYARDGEYIGRVWVVNERAMLAAALRAVADQVLPEEPLYGGDQRWMHERDARQSCRKKLLAIADELEEQS